MENRVPMTLRDSFFEDSFFKSSWEEFEKLRQEMTKESMDFWKQSEQDIKSLMSSSMEKSSSSQMQESSSSSLQKSSESKELARTSNDDHAMSIFGSSWIFPRRWMLPKMFGLDDSLESRFKELNLFQDKDEQVIRVKDDDSKFEISLDTQGYRPDELKVNVSGNVLSVDAKHEEKSDNKLVSRQFSRKYTLPEGCEPMRVHSNLSSDGILVINAPKKPAITTSGSSKPIPVTHTKH